MKKNSNLIGHLTAIFTITVWGTTFVSTKILLRDFTPVEILLIRFVIGLLALTIISPKHMQIKERRHELLFAGAGLSGITLYFLLENIALTYSQAANIAVILSVVPIFTAILAHFLIKSEKFKLNFFLGFLVAIIGIGLISFDGNTTLKLNPIGDILAILAALVWAIYSILIRKITTLGYDTIYVTRKTFLYGIIFMLPAMFFFGFKVSLVQIFKLHNLFHFLFLGLGASALCFVTWNYTVKLLGVIKSSVYIYAAPVITVISAVLVLHERITVVAAIGTVLTLAGLVLSEAKIEGKKNRSKNVNNYIVAEDE